MKTRMTVAAIGFGFVLVLTAAGLAWTSQAQPPGASHGHAMRHAAERPADGPTEPGQSAFAAIAEIVTLLREDSATDWARIDIEALRQHLIDMDNVTLRAVVGATERPCGMAFDVTAADAAVSQSIRRMIVAHAAAMSGVDGMAMAAEEIPGGARLVVTGGRVDMIRGLGFIGLMTLGMHHQAHHLALARGGDPHGRH